MAGETCVAVVWTGYSHRTCGKPAKGVFSGDANGTYHGMGGKPGCGVHLAAERRIVENDRRNRQEYDDRVSAAARSRQRADALAVRLGVRVSARGFDGEISYTDLEALAARLDRLAEYESS